MISNSETYCLLSVSATEETKAGKEVQAGQERKEDGKRRKPALLLINS